MTLKLLHHYTIRTVKLQKTRDFYVDVLGMEDGDRPAFDFPGHWLYIGEQPVVHLIGMDPEDTEDPEGNQEVDSLDGTGAIDHVAFNITEPDHFRQRIEQSAVPYQEKKVPGGKIWQMFLTDPNGVTIELNYSATP